MGTVLPNTHDLVARGQDALRRGDWEQAREAFTAALAQQEVPEALEGLSWAAFWLNDQQAVFAARNRAYQGYRARGDVAKAAWVAIWIGSDYLDFRGDFAIANGWYLRAARLLEGRPVSAERGWLALHRGALALEEEDVDAVRSLAAQAVAIGREADSRDVEVLGLAMEGIALVSEGDVRAGMGRLDEATTAALGGDVEHLFTVTWACCYLIYACERARDYGRAAQWCEQMEEWASRLRIRFVLGVCRSHYAAVLVWRGEWRRAEAVLLDARADLGASRPMWMVESTVRLGDLRRRQGRYAEAETLFQEAQPHPLARLGNAALALERGDAQTAVDDLERFLRRVSPRARTQRAAGLELWIRAAAALDRCEEARERVAELRDVAATVGTPPLRASLQFATGCVERAAGNLPAARACFEDAVDVYQECGAPYESSCARLELAAVLHELGQPAAARWEAIAAAQQLRRLGAAAAARRAARLCDPDGVRPGALTAREMEVLRLVGDGLSDRQMATRLRISEHTVHRHVANILIKLGVTSRSAAVAYAAREQLL